MKMHNKDLGTQAINLRLALCKVCITACFAIALSLFLFACGSNKDANSSDSTATIQADTSAATQIDTPATTPVDTAVRPDSTPMH